MSLPIKFDKYSSIENIRKKSVEVLEEGVCVTEKLHGTNVRFANTKSGLIIGGRNQVMLHPGIEEKQYDSYGFCAFILPHPGLERLKDRVDLLDHVIYGEFFGDGVQKGVKYCDGKDFRVFDIRHPEGYFLNWEDVERICGELRFLTVPVLHKGKIDFETLSSLINIDSVEAKRNRTTTEGKNTAEGVVVKPLIERLDRRGDRIIVKYKSDQWAENTKNRVGRTINPEDMAAQKSAQEFALSVTTQGRAATILEHITRDGNPEISMQRTSEFLREFIRDVMKENSEIYSSLSDKESKMYNKTISSQALILWKKIVKEN